MKHIFSVKLWAKAFGLLVLAAIIRCGPVLADTLPAVGPLTLWYQQPGKPGMNEALPIGNGTLGGLIYGDARQERIVLNEISFWTGSEVSSDDYSKMGAYQMLGELFIDMNGATNGIENYRRSLDLASATHTVTYKSGGVTYTREAFAAQPGQIIAVRLSADKPGACSGTVRLVGAHGETTGIEPGGLSYYGEFANGLHYGTKFIVLPDGGKVSAGDGVIEFKECNSMVLLLTAATDYVMNYDWKYRVGDFHFCSSQLERRLIAARKLKFEQIRDAHLQEYRQWFDRVSLDVGTSPADRLCLPIDKRKVLQAEKGGDPDLEELMFQYGRYLLISCSRPGGLPANLQGLWNDSNNPPWHSDYHVNINIQMNYWLAEAANLSECHTPLFDLVTSQLEPWRKATANEQQFKGSSAKVRGWAVRTSHGINGDQGWQWDVTANAWYCQHFWLHYAYTGDKAWLKEVAYPVLKETCEFWEDHLKTLPDGRLVVPNGWSPEHGPHEDGVSYSQEIVWDLFNNYVAASEVLGLDAAYRAKIASMRDKLVAPQIGKWGQLQEWMVDRDDPNDHHRHTSHLFAVYPGQQISIAKTPDLAAAAKKSLLARGEEPGAGVVEWSFAWRSALYARLHDGENAHRLFQDLFSDRNTCMNLFGLHPPMQIDGNFGITAAVCEMLLQSHEDEINLLPALPKAWPTGHVKGLRARGGIEMEIGWKDGALESASLYSKTSGSVTVRCGKTSVRVLYPADKQLSLDVSRFK